MSNRIEKTELVQRVARKTGIAQNEAEQVVDATFEEIYEALRSYLKSSIMGFHPKPHKGFASLDPRFSALCAEVMGCRGQCSLPGV